MRKNACIFPKPNPLDSEANMNHKRKHFSNEPQDAWMPALTNQGSRKEGNPQGAPRFIPLFLTADLAGGNILTLCDSFEKCSWSVSMSASLLKGSSGKLVCGEIRNMALDPWTHIRAAPRGGARRTIGGNLIFLPPKINPLISCVFFRPDFRS